MLCGSAITHLKLFKRGECSIPEGHEYLMVVSHDLGADGNWDPIRVESFQTINELKNAIRAILAVGDGLAIRASGQFEWLALELKLPLLSAEWSNL